MKVLFITIGQLVDINAPGIYTDLLREFRRNGHDVYIMTSRERRNNLPTECREESGFHFLRVRIGNITKCGIIEKGISTVMVERQYISALKKHFGDIKFDLVMYTTPPITFLNTVKYVKNRDHARTYLILKDIFPQNAVDIGMLSKTGVKGLLYRHFRKQEKKLYQISDTIGCMSQANVDYIIRNNPEVDPARIEVCPNTIDPVDMSCTPEERIAIREKYDIPTDKTIFVYGGNLGKPQGIPFVIDCLRKCENVTGSFFLIVGSGTEYNKLAAYVADEEPCHVKLMKQLPKEDYDRMIGACDVGLIFLDHRFTIPNFPSRLLSYMAAKIPVLAVTDPNTDIGKVATEGGFGWWCESNDAEAFRKLVEISLTANRKAMGERAYEYLTQNYLTSAAYQTIEK